MNVTGVIVTYANRFHHLRRVVEAALAAGVQTILVVDNGSEEDTKVAVKQMQQLLGPRLRTISLPKNLGSAAGYSIGLMEARNSHACEFIWMLDDDNKPEKNALKELLKAWSDAPQEDKEKRLALSSCRYERDLFRRILAGENHRNWIKRKDYFMSFHFADIAVRIGGKISERSEAKQDWGNRVFRLPYAPFGGLFLHKRMLDEIGYPLKRLFSYMDDFEFTFRIIRKGGKILLVPGSVVVELEESWYVGDNRWRNLTPVFLRGTMHRRRYFTARNGIIFDILYFRRRKSVYWLNKGLYLGYLATMAVLYGKLPAFRILLRAVRSGERLGEMMRVRRLQA